MTHPRASLLAAGFFGCLLVAQQQIPVPNGGFETVTGASKVPDGWHAGISKGTKATIEIDETVAHSGKRSVRLSDQSPTAPYIYGQIASPMIKVAPSTTYIVRFFARGAGVGRSFAGVRFDGAGGSRRQGLPVGTYDWREVTCQVTTPADCRRMSIFFNTDGVTDAVWIDDVTLSVSPAQLANLAERRYPKDFPGFFPRTPGRVPEHLVVADATGNEADNMLLVALQGIVNRQGPRLYLINRTNPAHYDEVWLKYMQEKGYTGQEERIDGARAVIRRFRSEINGLIVFDPDLPGTMNAAWMLAGLKNALPASPATAAKLDLPIVEDLRGRWKRNVDVYRYIFDNYWGKMCHHVLAWEVPRRWQENSSRDYQVQWNVFSFWQSTYGDHEKGSDPPAEEQFINELLAATPGNVPVMGWMNDGRAGIEEYQAAHLLSEYGKWIPGSGFNSNVSVLSAIHPDSGAGPRPAPAGRSGTRPTVKLDRNKIYISLNVLDSGDAQWYWQLYQRKIWADPVRGELPIGYGMNVTILDVLPLVAQWYAENATPNDTLFGLFYMNVPVYATRFREEDRARIWKEYVALFDDYRRKMGLEGIELYDGADGSPAASDELLQRFTRGMPGLDYILAGLGRHSNITPANVNSLLDNTVVFHTATRFKVWGHAGETRSMGPENAWLLDEIKKNAPATRPGFMSVQGASWFYYPAWFKDLQQKLPPDYVVVSPKELARLYRESRSTGITPGAPHQQ